MPGAALDTAKRLSRTKGRRLRQGGDLFNEQALAKVFRAKLLAAITAQHLALPPSYPKERVVDCKNVGTGEKALIYLGRYLYRGVIQERDILSCEHDQVPFRYREAKLTCPGCGAPRSRVVFVRRSTGWACRAARS